jgi:hypothetical protein
MNKTLIKKITLIVVMLMMIVTLIVALQGNGVLAADDPQHVMPTIDTIEGAGSDTDSVADVVGAILYITKIIAVGVALIMLAVLAIKYMYSAPNDRATIKQHAVVYVVGAIVLFGAAGILSIIQQFSSNISANPNTTDPSAG